MSLSFTVFVSFLIRKNSVYGIAFSSGIGIIILFGALPKSLHFLFWIIMISLLIVEIKFFFSFINKERLILTGISFIGILLTVLPFFTFEYSQPNSMVKLLNSHLHNDTIYHVAMASMWKSYHAISHGLHGLSQLEYHYGSHLLMAGASSLLKISSFESYSHFFGFFCMPLLSISCIALAEEYLPSKTNTDFFKKILAYCFLLIGTGVLIFGGVFYRFALWPSFYESESYIVSLILFFNYYSILKNSNYLSSVLNPIFTLAILGLMTITKISTGFCGLILLGSWALLSSEKFWTRNWFYKWMIFFIGSLVFLGLYISINPSSGDAYFQPFQFVNTYIDFKAPLYVKYAAFILVHFSFFLVAALFYSFHFKDESIRNSFPLWYWLGAFLAFLVGLSVLTFFNIMGGSGYYFSNVPMFMVLPFLICIPNFIKDLKPILRNIFIILLLVISFFNAPQIIYAGGKSFLMQISQAYPANFFAIYIQRLDEIRKDKSSLNALVYIPRTETAFWKDIKPDTKPDWTCKSAGYIISAISERPALYGWPSNECYSFLCGPRFHSNGLCEKSKNNFSDEELLSETKRLGFSKVYIVTASETRIVQ